MSFARSNASRPIAFALDVRWLAKVERVTVVLASSSALPWRSRALAAPRRFPPTSNSLPQQRKILEPGAAVVVAGTAGRPLGHEFPHAPRYLPSIRSTVIR